MLLLWLQNGVQGDPGSSVNTHVSLTVTIQDPTKDSIKNKSVIYVVSRVTIKLKFQRRVRSSIYGEETTVKREEEKT